MLTQHRNHHHEVLREGQLLRVVVRPPVLHLEVHHVRLVVVVLRPPRPAPRPVGRQPRAAAAAAALAGGRLVLGETGPDVDAAPAFPPVRDETIRA